MKHDRDNGLVCRLCGAASQRVVMQLHGRDGHAYRAVRCPACAIVYSDPLPSFYAENAAGSEVDAAPDGYASLYDEDYYASNWGEEGKEYTDSAKQDLRFIEADRQREAIAAITGVKRGRMLDVGCGDGSYLEGFRRAGWEVYGVEVSPVAANWARENFRLPVLEGEFESLRLPPGFFDLIRMKHCIEHLPNPHRAVRRVFELLRPGGIAVIDTDNSNGLRSRTEIAIRGCLGPFAIKMVKALMKKELAGRYGRLTPPIHLYTFNPASMRRMAGNCGFELIDMHSVAHGDPVWFPLVSRFRGHPFEVAFRMLDWIGWKCADRGEAFVSIWRRPK